MAKRPPLTIITEGITDSETGKFYKWDELTEEEKDAFVEKMMANASKVASGFDYFKN